jgi:hypothetical protein
VCVCECIYIYIYIYIYIRRHFWERKLGVERHIPATIIKCILIPVEPYELRNKYISKLCCFGFGVVSYLLIFHNVDYLLLLFLLVLDGLVWFGLVYLCIHSVTYVKLDASIYRLQFTIHLVIYRYPHNSFI